MRSIKKKDVKYINYLLSSLDQLKKDLIYEKDLFAAYLLKKEVDCLKNLLNSKIKLELKNEKNSRTGVRK
jgi:hypothetical protein